MKKFIQEGDVLTLTAPYTRTAGQGALVGAIFGVAVNDVTSAAAGEFAVEGVFGLTKVGSQAWSVGDRIFWDDSNKYCTKTAGANTFIGVCTEAVGSGAGETTGNVALGDPSCQADNVAALAGTLTGSVDGTINDVAAAAGSCAGGSTPTASQVDTAIATAVAALVTSTNLALKEIVTVLNAEIAALKAAGLQKNA
jgi:predicted RecA/RadA family phage recombinase